jgi:hypothetical protein
MARDHQLEALRKKLAKVAPGGNLESLAKARPASPSSEGALESRAAPRTAGARLDSRVTRSAGRSAEVEAAALRKLANGDFDDVSPRERLELEAIVEAEGRPVAFIRGQPMPCRSRGPIHRRVTGLPAYIESAIPSSVAWKFPHPRRRPGHAPGTGFIVGPNLMMKRHVAKLFVHGVGRNRTRLSFVPGISTAIDFRRVPVSDSASVAISTS